MRQEMLKNVRSKLKQQNNYSLKLTQENKTVHAS